MPHLVTRPDFEHTYIFTGLVFVCNILSDFSLWFSCCLFILSIINCSLICSLWGFFYGQKSIFLQSRFFLLVKKDFLTLWLWKSDPSVSDPISCQLKPASADILLNPLPCSGHHRHFCCTETHRWHWEIEPPFLSAVAAAAANFAKQWKKKKEKKMRLRED